VPFVKLIDPFVGRHYTQIIKQNTYPLAGGIHAIAPGNKAPYQEKTP
jgi:hypothetical protein